MTIVRWDPFPGLEVMRGQNLPLFLPRTAVPSDLSVDVYERDDDVVAEMHLAGIDPSKLSVTVEDNYLRISGSTEESKEETKRNYYYKEIQRGSFERTVRLPENVTDEGATANYENGVLQVTLKKQDVTKKHRKIDVEVKGK